MSGFRCCDEIRLGPATTSTPTPEELARVVEKILRGKEILMHYRNGREAKNGDKIVQVDSNGQITAVGVLHSATPGNDYCNGSIAPIQPANCGACLCDCLHLDDVADVLREKGLDKRPQAK